MSVRITSIIVMAAIFGLWSGTVHAQTWQPPADSQRCPSKWGPNDERGAGNHMKPETVLRAARLIRTGEVIELGHVLKDSMPLGGRSFRLYTKPMRPDPVSNRRGSNEELVIAEMGQVGTQFDGFAHATIGDSFYNCHKLDDIATRNGFTKLGVQNVGTVMTRGVLIDIPALKGVQILSNGYEITEQDLRQALQRQNLTLQPGDAVIINTGKSRTWGKEGGGESGGRPGIGIPAAEWLVRQDPMLVGSDNSGVEVTPNRHPNGSFEPKLSGAVHQILLVVNGIHILENMNLNELVDKRVYEFALVLQPLKLQGASGSTVAPVAIR